MSKKKIKIVPEATETPCATCDNKQVALWEFPCSECRDYDKCKLTIKPILL